MAHCAGQRLSGADIEIASAFSAACNIGRAKQVSSSCWISKRRLNSFLWQLLAHCGQADPSECRSALGSAAEVAGRVACVESAR